MGNWMLVRWLRALFFSYSLVFSSRMMPASSTDNFFRNSLLLVLEKVPSEGS